MRTGNDMMAGQVEVFSYPLPQRRRWAKRYRFLLWGAGLLALHAVVILGALHLPETWL